MKVRRMILMLAVGRAMALGALTHAGSPDGLLVVNKTDAKAQAMGLSVCNIYGRFNDTVLVSVAFSRMITQDGSDFWQHEFGLETAPLGFLMPRNPTAPALGASNGVDELRAKKGNECPADYRDQLIRSETRNE